MIFCNATSRAKSGEPWLGFSSRLNGEKPQSSVAPSRSFGMCLAAGHELVADLLGGLDRGFSGLITPMKQTCATPSASSRLYWPQSR